MLPALLHAPLFIKSDTNSRLHHFPCKWGRRQSVVHYLEMRRIAVSCRPHTPQLSQWPLTPRFVQSPFWLRVGLWNRLAFTLSPRCFVFPPRYVSCGAVHPTVTAFPSLSHHMTSSDFFLRHEPDVHMDLQSHTHTHTVWTNASHSCSYAAVSPIIYILIGLSNSFKIKVSLRNITLKSNNWRCE